MHVQSAGIFHKNYFSIYSPVYSKIVSTLCVYVHVVSVWNSWGHISSYYLTIRTLRTYFLSRRSNKSNCRCSLSNGISPEAVTSERVTQHPCKLTTYIEEVPISLINIIIDEHVFHVHKTSGKCCKSYYIQYIHVHAWQNYMYTHMYTRSGYFVGYLHVP